MTTLDRQSRDWMDDRVEGYIDGALCEVEASRFDRVALMDEDLERELALARNIASTLRAMPDAECPDEVVHSIMAHVRRDIGASAWRRIQTFFLGLNAARLKPVLAMAMLLVIVISSTRIGRETPPPEPAVAVALDEIKWTLAYLSDFGKATGMRFRQSVIEPHVVAPMSRSIGIVMEN